MTFKMPTWIDRLKSEAEEETRQGIKRCHVCGVLEVSLTCPSCAGDYRADCYEPEEEEDDER